MEADVIVHVFQMFPTLVAGKMALGRCAEFIQRVTGEDAGRLESSNTFFDHQGRVIKRMGFDQKLGLFSAKL